MLSLIQTLTLGTHDLQLRAKIIAFCTQVFHGFYKEHHQAEEIFDSGLPSYIRPTIIVQVCTESVDAY